MRGDYNRAATDDAPDDDDWQPIYSPWRHGGWYVDNLRYPSGAVGCVARRAGGRWSIACDERAKDYTYPDRDTAARAERRLIREGKLGA